GDKLRRFKGVNTEIWLRYLVAGIIAPAIMGCYFLIALATHSSQMFVLAMYALMLLVGWHYAKQGFGVFMILSALKQIRYSRLQRLFLLLNAYIVWTCYAIVLFTTPIFGQGNSQVVWDIRYGNMNFLSVPDDFLAAMGMVFVGSA